MTQQLEMFEPRDMAPDDTSAKSFEIIEPSGKGMPSDLAEELEGVAERVRDGLHKMNANHIEIGRELRVAKERLTRGQFLSWVGSACGLSPRIARVMMRAADLALSAPSTPETVGQRGVPTRLFEGQKIRPRVVKDVVRAAKEHEPARRGESGLEDHCEGQSAHLQPELEQSEVPQPATSPISRAELREVVHVE